MKLELKEKLNKGKNLTTNNYQCISWKKKLSCYKEKYEVDDNFIEKDSIECTTENMKIILEDTKHF